MAKKITNLKQLKDYLNGINERAEHHAQNVDKIADYLIGHLIRIKDDKDMEVMEKDGEMKNCLWIYIRGKRYAFSYNHDNVIIEIREGSIKGEVIGSFNNQSDLESIKMFFEKL